MQASHPWLLFHSAFLSVIALVGLVSNPGSAKNGMFSHLCCVCAVYHCSAISCSFWCVALWQMKGVKALRSGLAAPCGKLLHGPLTFKTCHVRTWFYEFDLDI